jgi:hypothetical protein
VSSGAYPPPTLQLLLLAGGVDAMASSFVALPPARLSAACCRCSSVLCGDECVAFVMEPRTLLRPRAAFKVRVFLDAPAALRGHHASKQIRDAAIRVVALLVGRCTRYSALIVRPSTLAFGCGVFAARARWNHGGGRFRWSDEAKGIELLL